MQKRVLFPAVLSVFLLILISIPFRAFASQQTQQATPTPGTILAWTPDTTIADGVRFVWLRTTPAPNADIRLTVYPGALFRIQPNVAPVYDGYGQVWWLVQVPVLNRFGWVEQNSLREIVITATAQIPATSTALPTVEPLPTIAGSPVPAVTVTPGATSINPPPTVPFVTLPAQITVTGTGRPTPEPWRIPNVLFVKSSVPFVWLRALPNSAAAVVDSVELGGLVIVAGDPVYDGVQWWWKVQSSYTGRIGWAEQNSLERAEYKTPTPAPVNG
jgi:hypothetical protein